MKKAFYLFLVAVFALTATMALAQGKVDPVGKPAGAEGGITQPAKTVNCCNKGDCKQIGTEADCTKAGGKVVKDCKDCK
jgi:hypothetical protein